MRNYKFTIAALVVLIITAVFTGFKALPNDNDFAKKWEEVDQLAKKGQPQSALKIIDDIYSSAKADKNTPQVIKALIYKISMQSTYTEDYQLNSILTFENELETASEVEKALLQSLLAELYQSYYQQNQWTINNRQQSISYDNDDIISWDATAFAKKISSLYLESINNKGLISNIKLDKFKNILEQDSTVNKNLWPTLYDLLANRAMDYFTSPEAEIGQLSTKLNENEDYFLPVGKFVDVKIPEETPQQITLNIFQNLLNLHLQSDNIEALVDLDIKRLNFLHQNSKQYSNLDNYYLSALEKSATKYQSDKAYPMIAYQIAKYYYDNASVFAGNVTDKNKDYIIKAHDICNKAIAEFPGDEGADLCKNLIYEIERTNFGFEIPVASMPNKPVLSLVTFININTLYFKIVKSDPLAFAKNNDIKQYMKKVIKEKPVLSWTQEIPEANDFRNHSFEMAIPALEPGYYVILASNSPDFPSDEDVVFKGLWISNLSYILSYNKGEGINEIYTLDRETGNPAGDVQITVYQRKYDNSDRDYKINKIKTLMTDKTGYAVLEPDKNANYGTYLLMFEKKENSILSENYLNFHKFKPDEKWQRKVYFFTDRAIYRPGQVVNFKALFTERRGNEVRLVNNENAKISFVNSSGKEISNIEKNINTHGSVNGTFSIPKDVLNGNMMIKTRFGSTNISVEDYKLPTFEVVFDSIEGQNMPGDNIKITGKATGYAGNAINNATVKYTVVKRTVFPIPYFRGWFPYYNQPDVEMASGTMQTSANGTFEISFLSADDDNIPSFYYPVSNYLIHADVSDISGEMQSADAEIRVGKNPVILNISMDDMLSQNAEIKGYLNAKNLNETPITLDVKTELYKLQAPDRLINERRWQTPDFYIIPKDEFVGKFPHDPYKNEDDKSTWNKTMISSQNISVTGKTVLPTSLFANAEPGEYFLSVMGKDEKGNTVETGSHFTIYSPSGKQMPDNIIAFEALSKTKAEPGETIVLNLGSGAKKTKILYEIVYGENVVERNWISVSKSQKIIEIPVKEEYRGNFTINTTMVKFNRLYSTNNIITVPFTNKELEFSLDTHRDFLTPGSKEQWTVTIADYENNKVAANLLAGMYDAALDVYRENNWNIDLYYNKTSFGRWESRQFAVVRSSYLYNKDINYIKTKPVAYPSVNWFGYPIYGNTFYTTTAMRGVQPPAFKKEVMNDVVSFDIVDNETETLLSVENDEEKPKEAAIPLRKNFNETAFFFPELRTGENGEAQFSFTTPDALTKWKVQLMAYTGDLKTGTFETTIKSKKDLMVIPNLPRFIRTGDTLSFTAKVTNFTEKDINAVTEIEFFDPVSEKILDIFIDCDRKQTSDIKALQSEVISWKIASPENAGLLAYRIKSHTDNFSDGEERMFPVLTNRMLVTSTMPMHISGNTKEEFTFDDMLKSNSETLKNVNYTVEFASNPAWYAIQAIPYLEENNSRSNTALFNRYYANAISSYIVNSNPRIKAVFESWSSLTPDALLSNLEKNQELKNIIIESTPWILDAENETEQKRRIGVLMDVNRMANEKETILDKLQKEQLSSGAWPWFEGMPADRYTTQSIILNLAKLHQKGIIDLTSDKRRLSMVKKAVSYLDNEMEKRYLLIKNKGDKALKSQNIASTDIQYLYLRNILTEILPVPSQTETVVDYFITQSKKYWIKESKYLQGMIAQYLYAFGHRNESEAIVRSLQETSMFNKEMGMYWRSENGHSWYNAPVETQAMMIETFAKLSNSPGIIEQMKIWLLKQKQVQNWKTTSATADAIFALLMYGDNNLNNTDLVDVTVGNEKISTVSSDNTPEAGTGYFTQSWKGKEINNDLANINVVNPNNNIAWGAAYWQYTEDMDKVKSNVTSLTIDKQLFVEKKVDGSMKLVKIEEHETLKVGDKIVVRLIIGTDRDMEYIHVSDMRATCFEPAKQLSGYTYSGGLWYYKNITDIGMDMFIQRLNKGIYIVDYPLYVTQKGSFANGIATIQSSYAPEFASHSSGIRIVVEE